MKRSETVGNSQKRSETWSGQNLFNPHLFLNKHFRATPFFFWRSKGVQGETVGNSRRWHLRSAKKYLFFSICSWKMFENCVKTGTFLPSEGAISDCFQPFPLGHLWTFKKKLRGNAYLKTNAGWTSFGLIMFPTVSDCFRPVPTVCDRFRPFHVFWTINWTNSIYGRLIQCKPVQTMTLKFGATLVRVHCTKYCILTLISNIP